MAKRINKAQLTSVYWPAWRAAEKVLVSQGDYSKADAEELRKDIHVAITGSDCSSKDLTNRQLDECLKRFAAIATPQDGKRQADLADQAAKRVRWKIREIQQRMALSDAYVETIALKTARRSIIQCDEDQLIVVLTALTYHEGRHPAQPDPA